MAEPPVGRRGEVAVLLERQGDARLEAQAVLGRRILDGSVRVSGVGVNRFTDPVVVDVAGHRQAASQVHAFVLLLSGVAIPTTGWWIGRIHIATGPQHVGAGVVPRVVGPRHGTHPEDLFVPGGVGREKLEGGSRRVLALDGPVEHWKVVGRVVQDGPLFEREATDRLVGVIRRVGGHGHHRSDHRIQQHHGAPRGVEGG